LIFWLILLGFLWCCHPIPAFADLLAEPAFAETLCAGRQVLWQARAPARRTRLWQAGLRPGGSEAFFTGLSIF
jgi:hypothetical protein